MVAVMFPKIVKVTPNKTTDMLRFTLLLTAGLCNSHRTEHLGAGFTVADGVRRVVLIATPLVPWFIAAWRRWPWRRCW